MTRSELNEKIKEAMAELKGDGILAAIRNAWRDYVSEIKGLILDEEKGEDNEKYGNWQGVPSDKRDELLDEYMERYPTENYCYVMFKDNGDLRGFTIDHQQYWQGNSGPTSAIFIGPEPTLKEIENEISNDLHEAIETED